MGFHVRSLLPSSDIQSAKVADELRKWGHQFAGCWHKVTASDGQSLVVSFSTRVLPLSKGFLQEGLEGELKSQKKLPVRRADA